MTPPVTHYDEATHQWLEGPAPAPGAAQPAAPAPAPAKPEPTAKKD